MLIKLFLFKKNYKYGQTVKNFKQEVKKLWNKRYDVLKIKNEKKHNSI